MFLVDTHCHINAEYYPDGLEPVFANMLDNGVRRLVFASSDLKSSREAVEVAKRQLTEPEVYATVGIHPHEAGKVSQDYLSELGELAREPRVVAIGEIGLDYYYELTPRDVQKRVFVEQIEFAKSIGKPVMLHLRSAKNTADGDANSEALEILHETEASETGGVVHCFSGTMQNALEALEMGFYISFDGPITYPANMQLREIAMEIPLDRILCETDSPYLAPQGFRGRPNEPCHVRQVYELLAMLKKMPLEDFAAAVRENGERIFNIGAANV